MTSKSRIFFRRLGFSRLALEQWVRRATFVIGGLCVGGAAVLMALMADRAQDVFRAILDISPYLALIVTPLGFGFCVFLTRRVFPNSQGSGIPQVIAARQIEDPTARLALVSLRVAFGKVVVMMIGLLCGASIGREGPTVQVGASIMGAIGRRAPVVYHQGLLLAGAAAGIAAAFNTPLAGIVFAIEELSRSFESKTSGLVLGCIIAAGVTSLGLLGDYTYFGSTSATLPLGRAWFIVPVCALVGGIAGGLFSRIVVTVLTGSGPHAVLRLARTYPVPFAMVCGLGVAGCGMLGHHSSYGTGYEEARGILHGTTSLTLAFAPAKFFATVFSAISGIPGGIFAPSLAIGAGLGAELHALFQSVPIGALALIGMAAYLAGVVQTPITSFVIVSEMTQDHAMVIPLMVTALIADRVSKLICKDGLYHALSKPFMIGLPTRLDGSGNPPVPYE
ncbi:MAG: chloride channel protein [Beijerinckiaceae bacterium]|nr:chloride channel protein [Beijerinckiaceae bacterium]